MKSFLIDNFYLFNFIFTTAYTLAMLIYIGGFSPEDRKTKAFQRFLVSMVSWAAYDLIISRAAQTLHPDISFALFRYLSIMWLIFAAFACELCVAIILPIQRVHRILLYGPYALFYLAAVFMPHTISASVYGIPRGYPGFPGPWQIAYTTYWMAFIAIIMVWMFKKAMQESDKEARTEKMILILGVAISVSGLALSRKFLDFFGPGFPALGNIALAPFSLAAFLGLKYYGRVLSPKALYKTIIQTIPSGIAHVRGGKITWANKSLASLIGFSKPDHLLNLPVSSLNINPPELFSDPELVSGAGFRDKEASLASRDGAQVNLLLGATPFDADAPEKGFLLVFNDLSALKTAEKNYQDVAELYMAISESTGDGLLVSEVGRAVIPYNSRFKDMWNATDDLIASMDINGLRDYILDQIEQPAELIHPDAYTNMPPIETIDVAYLKNGRIFEVHSSPLMRNDEPAGRVWSFRDITERRQAEIALKESEQRFRNIFDRSPNAICITAIKDGTIITVNDKFCELFQLKKEDIIGRTTVELNILSGPQRELIINDVFEKEESNGRTWEVRVHDGGIKTISVFSRVIQLEGQDLLLSLIHDQTEQKRLEIQLRQAQRMESVGALAGGIAHDFNNILQAISGYVQLVIHSNNIDNENASYLGRIQTAVDRAAGLIKQLLAFSRKVQPEMKIVNLNVEVVKTVGILERTIPKMIALETRLAEDIKSIKGDPAHLEQILMNLAANARDAMPEGGKIIIETGNATLDEKFCQENLGAKPGEFVMLRFSDNGCGMTREEEQRMFEPFFTTKGIGKGTGLGLASVYGAVKSHQGYIACQTKAGRGTTFSLYFPVSEEDLLEAEAVKRERRDLKGGSETILLVDDEEDILNITGSLLKSRGYIVLSAKSGEEALEVYQQQGPAVNLVVLDLGMPGMGGGKCLEELIKIDPEAKVIIASGYSAEENIKTLKDRMASEFIRKPYGFDELLGKIRKVLDGE